VLRLATTLFVLLATTSAQDCLTRKLLVNVSTSTYQRVVGLQPGQFRGRFRDKPVEIVRIESVQLAPRIIFLLDSSGSMREGSELQLAASLLDATFSFLPHGSQVAFNSFSEQIDGPIVFDNDRQKLHEKLVAMISRPKHKGSLRTALLQSIDTAIQAFGEVRRGDSIVIATDGGDNASKGKPWEVQKTIERAGIRVFVYEIAGGVRFTPEEMAAPTLLHELAERTGGDVVAVNKAVDPGSEKIAPVLVHLARQMAGHLTNAQELTIRFPASNTKIEKLKLEFAKGDPSTKGLQLEYPQYIRPCEVSAASATQP
jgi:Mg-chelatase subunit ChlD